MSRPLLQRRADPIRDALCFTLSYWRRHAGLTAATALVMMAATLADVATPVFAGRLVDAAAGRGESAVAAVRGALAWLLGLAALGIVLRTLGFRGVVVLTSRTMAAIGQEAFGRVQRLSTDWHANNFAGSTVRKVTRGMWALDLLGDTLLVELLPASVVLVGSAVMLAWQWPALGLAILAGATVYVGLAIVLSLRYVAPAARLANLWDTRIGGALADAVSCNAVVKAFGSEDREDMRLARTLGRWRQRTSRAWRRGTNAGTAQQGALLGLRTVILGGAAWLWVDGRATPGELAFVLSAYGLVHGYLRDVGQHIRNLQRSVNEMEDLVGLDREPFGVADRPGAGPLDVRAGRIVFDRVTFRYGGHADPLYRDLGLAIAAGERVGLVGRSGSGKTTVVKLIQRLYDVTGGRITIDGTDIAGVTQASLRRSIAAVQQEPMLFHRSLAENIAYARPGATPGEIEAAARLANASGFIERLPKGFGTLVGERGVKLSGGERQRVAIARAFLADAPILILDEATSSLDSDSEALIQEAIERLMRGRTTLVIAHRLSTVQAMDRILVFDRGRVVEDGPHAALVRLEDGVYRRLFERQALDLAKGFPA